MLCFCAASAEWWRRLSHSLAGHTVSTWRSETGQYTSDAWEARSTSDSVMWCGKGIVLARYQKAECVHKVTDERQPPASPNPMHRFWCCWLVLSAARTPAALGREAPPPPHPVSPAQYLELYGLNTHAEHIVFIDDYIVNTANFAMYYGIEPHEPADAGDARSTAPPPPLPALRRVTSVWWDPTGVKGFTAAGGLEDSYNPAHQPYRDMVAAAGLVRFRWMVAVPRCERRCADDRVVMAAPTTVL